jgi:hypothetical protein
MSSSVALRKTQENIAKERGVDMTNISEVKAWQQAMQKLDGEGAWNRVLAKHNGDVNAAIREYNGPGWRTGYN